VSTTPTTNTTPIAHASREADIDLRGLQFHRPLSVPQTIRGASSEIDAAVERYVEIIRKRGEAANLCRQSLQAVLRVRTEHAQAIRQAALQGKAEPKTVDVSGHFEEAREQYRRARALNFAVEEALRSLVVTLTNSRDLLDGLRKEEYAMAREALEQQEKVQAILDSFAQQRGEADWLENVIGSREHGRHFDPRTQPRPSAATIKEARIALTEATL
jgi:hypothetical protein